MIGDAVYLFSLISVVCFGTSLIIWLTEDVILRAMRNRAARQRRRELARQDVTDMQQHRARRRMVGGGL